MSRVAQKEDLSDPEVIKKFADSVGNERRLTALYLLTVADIRGTSPKVWNAWKGKLLEDLYRLTLRALGGALPNQAAQANARKQRGAAPAQPAARCRPASSRRCGIRSTRVISRATRRATSPGMCACLDGRIATTEPIVRARLSSVGEGLQVLVYSPPDRTDLFARICGYFDTGSFDILDAKVHTTRKGYALDTFQVTSPLLAQQYQHYRDLILLVENQLAVAINADGPLPEPSQGRVSRRVKSFPVTPRITLRPDERAQRWLLTVSTSDRSGLLYAIARVLARHQINLHLAKITTLGERVEDTFLIDGDRAAAEPHADRDRIASCST